jgi:hypothetical protein
MQGPSDFVKLAGGRVGHPDPAFTKGIDVLYGAFATHELTRNRHEPCASAPPTVGA